jgi:hypothetical protein
MVYNALMLPALLRVGTQRDVNGGEKRRGQSIEGSLVAFTWACVCQKHVRQKMATNCEYMSPSAWIAWLKWPAASLLRLAPCRSPCAVLSDVLATFAVYAPLASLESPPQTKTVNAACVALSSSPAKHCEWQPC